jgi:hypothetical protein
MTSPVTRKLRICYGGLRNEEDAGIGEICSFCHISAHYHLSYNLFTFPKELLRFIIPDFLCRLPDYPMLHLILDTCGIIGWA